MEEKYDFGMTMAKEAEREKHDNTIRELKQR
jgi:hypothetical protein